MFTFGTFVTPQSVDESFHAGKSEPFLPEKTNMRLRAFMPERAI